MVWVFEQSAAGCRSNWHPGHAGSYVRVRRTGPARGRGAKRAITWFTSMPDSRSSPTTPRRGGPLRPVYASVYGSYVDVPLLRTPASGTTLPTSGTAALFLYHRYQQFSIVRALRRGPRTWSSATPHGLRRVTILAPTRTARATSSFGKPLHLHRTSMGPHPPPLLLRARWLEPKAGRFIGSDPLGYVDGMGLYDYLQSGPLQRLTRSGYSISCGGIRSTD